MSVLDLGGGWLMALGKLLSSEPRLSVKWEGDPASGCVCEDSGRQLLVALGRCYVSGNSMFAEF